MNKSEMARKLAAMSSGMSQAQAADVLDKVFGPNGVIADELDAGGKVSIGGFGTFEARERAARVGRNPRTGEAIRIAARRYPAFKAAKSLKDRVS